LTSRSGRSDRHWKERKAKERKGKGTTQTTTCNKQQHVTKQQFSTSVTTKAATIAIHTHCNICVIATSVIVIVAAVVVLFY
jgi:hypothetical protein